MGNGDLVWLLFHIWLVGTLTIRIWAWVRALIENVLATLHTAWYSENGERDTETTDRGMNEASPHGRNAETIVGVVEACGAPINAVGEVAEAIRSVMDAIDGEQE